jgi:DNA-binding NarL/FixJ family response regulator
LNASDPLSAVASILAFSAYLDAENQRNCVDVGIDGYIKKPSTVRSILEAVKRCFDVTEAAPNEE